MTLSGEQWLAQVFRPAVAGVSRARRERPAGDIPAEALGALGSRLAAQVQALGDTGVLTDEQESAALDALDQAGIMPRIRSVSSSMSSSTAASAVTPVAVRAGSAPVVVREPAGSLDPPALRGVLAGPRQLGHLGGQPVTLISTELWSDRILVDLYTSPGPGHRDQRAREQLEWIKRRRRGQAPERPDRAVAGSPLAGLTWDLRDEQGTAYRRTGGSAESGNRLDRQRMQWSPAPPVRSGRLTLLATDPTGTILLDTELPRPTT